MTTLEDFTALAQGAEVALAGRVARCPSCGRNGIEQSWGGAPAYVVHVQSSRVLGDGMLTEPRDYCLLARSPAPTLPRDTDH